jgi:hypothetical protein
MRNGLAIMLTLSNKSRTVVFFREGISIPESGVALTQNAGFCPRIEFAMLS